MRIKARVPALLVLTVLGFLFCRGSRTTTPPAHLIGVWTTTNPRYEERYFKLTTSSTMVVGKGDGLEDVYRIVMIEESTQDAMSRYTITYLSEGEEYNFHFLYDPSGDGMIRFVNQEGLNWTREEL